MSYLREHSTRSTPQSEPLAGQVPNSAGGHAWAVDDWERMRRFLVLGSEGGSYYAGERELTKENAEATRRCIEDQGDRAISLIVEISEAGRAPKNDPAIFALAMAAGSTNPTTRRNALDNLASVCRTGTHLFHFAAYVEQFRGWGPTLRRAIGEWYQREDIDALAYQLVKYRSRDGWSHKDLLRLAHPVPPGLDHDALYAWVVGREHPSIVKPRIVDAYERAQLCERPAGTASLIREYPELPREALNPDHLRSPEVWEALLDAGMPMTALIRNLATMTRIGLLRPMSAAVDVVCDQITSPARLRKARVHPLQVLVALKTYESGQSARGSATWNPVSQIVDALDGAFYEAFDNVEPTNKRTMLALDVSSSMGYPEIAGMPGITPAVATAALAMVTAKVEPNHMLCAFSHQFVNLTLSPRMRLDSVMTDIANMTFGGTDCALPMLTAQANRIPIDTFVILTDNETWHGNIHPAQALQRYRETMGIPAKLVVVAMTSNGFSIADPNDRGMLDVVGLDTATPQVISDFSRG